MSDAALSYRDWIGRTQNTTDRITEPAARILASILPPRERDFEKGCLPSLWHWLYFADVAPLSMTGTDGHPLRGGFLPPVTLPRRMWAGGELRFHEDLRFGDIVDRNSTISNVEVKEGRTGMLCFVTVTHAYRVDGRLAIEERQDIVYRGAKAFSGASTVEPRLIVDLWSEEISPSPVMLFRYSAATTNSHRIHYDRNYAVDEEGYPGLVVHGPLLATLLADLTERRSGKQVAWFSYQARSPVFDGAPFRVIGNPEGSHLDLAVVGSDGNECMVANAEITEGAER